MRSLLLSTGDRHAPARDGRGPGRHLDRLQHPRRAALFLTAAEPLEPVGPERVGRDHGDRHGPDHRVAQHRPVGRIDPRAHRLHDGDGPGRLDPHRPRASGFDQPYTWIIALARRLALGRRDRRVPGLHRRLRRRARPSSSPSAGCSSGAASSSRYASGPDDRADGQDLPAARWRPDRLARRRGRAGSSASSPASGIVYTPDRQPAPAPAVRLPGPPDVGRGDARRRRLRRRPRRRLGRQQLLLAAGSWRSTPAIGSRAAGGLQIPVGIAYPVLIVIGVTLVMTFLATRRRFGRYVFAIGGNPEAAELGGINIRRTIMLHVRPHGHPRAPSARPIQTARLNAARHEPRDPGRARRHRRGGHRRHVVRRRHRDDPRGRPRRRRHAVAPVGHGPAQGRLADPGHRRRRRPGRRRRPRHRPSPAGRAEGRRRRGIDGQ